MSPTTLFALCLAAAIALVAALLPLPYGYYQILRWVICIIALVVGCGKWNQAPLSSSGLILVAIVFNPFEIISFDRSTWAVIDLAAAGLFGWVAIQTRQGKQS